MIKIGIVGVRGFSIVSAVKAMPEEAQITAMCDLSEAALDEALKQTGPVWIECRIDRAQRVLPMIPAGGTVEDIMLD